VFSFIDVQKTPEPVLMPGAYRLMPKGRLAWLQRLAWRLLHKAGALEQAYDSQMKVERRVIVADTFMSRIDQQLESIFREFDVEPGRIIIGSEDYASLMREASVAVPFSFDARTLPGKGRKVMGLTVEVLPWVRGMVVVP
jgi:hypothetical protein